jgi:hypothetical protein
MWPREWHEDVFRRDGVLDLIDGAVYSSEIGPSRASTGCIGRFEIVQRGIAEKRDPFSHRSGHGTCPAYALHQRSDLVLYFCPAQKVAVIAAQAIILCSRSGFSPTRDRAAFKETAGARQLRTQPAKFVNPLCTEREIWRLQKTNATTSGSGFPVIKSPA